jgi:hypothetical protein
LHQPTGHSILKYERDMAASHYVSDTYCLGLRCR